MKSILKNNFYRRLVSIVFALIISSAVEYYFSMSHDFLVPITAVFVMLTSVGNLVYQGLVRFALIAVFVVILSLMLPPHHLLFLRVYDACLGAFIGIACNLFIFPRQADSEFRGAVLPILKAYNEYFIAIIDSLFEKDIQTLEINKINLEKQLVNLPVWVYARGFDLGLKRGHEYFLMKVHHIAEILFAMHHAARCQFDEEVRNTMRKSVYVVAEKIQEFFTALITVFQLQKLTEGVDDFEQQLHELDEKFQTLVPDVSEVIDMSQEDISFYQVIYALNDLRKALMKLGQALR